MSRRFYGEKKIETAEDQGDFVVIGFSDNTTLRIPKKLFEISVSKEPLQATALWDKQCAPVVRETLELWLGWDLQLEQLDYVINMLKTSIEYSLSKAGDELWGKKLKDRRMSDVDKVLKKDEQQTGEKTS